MDFFCLKCKNRLTVFDNFCNKCGSKTVPNTIPPDISEPELPEYFYCPACASKNNVNSLFCASCGAGIYILPEKHLFCPECGKKNPQASIYCSICGLNFCNWFAMKGEVAERFGYSENVALTEKMTGITYLFIKNKRITIGRNESNIIHIKCLWVSSTHCIIDLELNKLIDNNSTNGTFIDRNPARIQSVSLDNIQEFNLGSALTFNVMSEETLFVFHLVAIMKEKQCEKCVPKEPCAKLRKKYFILGKDGTVIIRKFDGLIINESDTNEPCYKFSLNNGFLYLTDVGKNIKTSLIFNDFSNLPDNWRMQKLIV